MNAASTTPIPPGTMTFRLAVERAGDVVHLVLRGTLGAEQATVPVPLTPAAARALASQLLGAAAAADPAGHEQILQAIADEFTRAALDQALAPGAVKH